MPRILFLVSSARSIKLTNGHDHETGYWAEEALKPYERFIAAGVDVLVVTPDGREPHADSYGLQPIFHYPDADEDYLLSVIRSFMPDADDIRVTLQHLTTLDLIAARRVFEALKAADMAPEPARLAIQTAARRAWAENRNFVEVLAADTAVTRHVDAGKLRALSDTVQRDAREASAKMKQQLASMPSFQKPRSLKEMSDDDILSCDAIFIPGGHGPMVDMHRNPDVARALRLLHEKNRPVAALCHGPAALLSAGTRADGLWMFDGYKMTAFNNEEEDQTQAGRLGMPWYLETGLKNAGAVFDDSPMPWVSHVVVDRNLITAQNPMSADAMADAVLKRLSGARV